MNAEIDVRAILPSIKVPTLVVHRHADKAVPVENSYYLAERVPGSKLVTLEGPDHLAFVDDVESLVGEVEEFLTGTRGFVGDDRVLATIMFTDIVASTELAAQPGDRAWREVLDSHDEMVGRQLERFRGREVKSTGDGLLATFDGPARAINCARAIALSATSPRRPDPGRHPHGRVRGPGRRRGRDSGPRRRSHTRQGGSGRGDGLLDGTGPRRRLRHPVPRPGAAMPCAGCRSPGIC